MRRSDIVDQMRARLGSAGYNAGTGRRVDAQLLDAVTAAVEDLGELVDQCARYLAALDQAAGIVGDDAEPIRARCRDPR